MVWKLMLLQVLWLSSAFGAPIALPGCQPKCGGINIPYPFGIGDNCYYHNGFDIICNETFDPPKAFLAHNDVVEVVDIKLDDGLLLVKHYIAYKCYDDRGNIDRTNGPVLDLTEGKPYWFSDAHNKFVAIGCDTIGYFVGMDKSLWTGCVSFCSNMTYVTDGTCSGIGCCETSIPKGLRTVEPKLSSFYNNTDCWHFNPCSYAFLADTSFHFNASVLSTYQDFERVQMTLEWAVGDKTCVEARKEKGGVACIAAQSKCYSSNFGQGYRCRCALGYQGNPYLPNGCEDIDECSNPQKNPCNQNARCINTPGGYHCACPRGMLGDGLKNGSGCTAESSFHGVSEVLGIIIGVGIGLGLLLLFISIALLIHVLKIRNAKKLKKKFFKQNRGLLLQQLISSNRDIADRMKIFTAKELQKATDNFDRSRIIGRGGHGTVYKGILLDQRVVAVKKSKIIVQREIDQFINEVVILSQINHRNVVKLFGCCLETEVPLLVYEFISNGTLSHHLHTRELPSSLLWEDRLRIAVEAARALAYLHSAASIAIVHRDVKSCNILLDDNFTAKLSDFGASRSVPLDQSRVMTAIQGTFGYLDPEYFQTSQLTDKSDVYSFGVILVELLTRERPVFRIRLHEERNLATHFLSLLREDHVFEILDPQIKNVGKRRELEVVVALAERCLRLKGEDRPTMKEVEMTLETLRGSKRQLQNHRITEKPEETETLLKQRSIEVSSSSQTSRQYSLEKELILSSNFPR